MNEEAIISLAASALEVKLARASRHPDPMRENPSGTLFAASNSYVTKHHFGVTNL